MSKKSKKVKSKSNGKPKLKKDIFGYFVCPKCGAIKRNPIYNRIGYPLGYYDSTGELKFNYVCAFDEENLKLIDKSLLKIVMLLNKLEIGFIDYVKPIIENEVKINPYIAIKSEDITSKGKKSLETLEVKLVSSHWEIDKNTYQFKHTLMDYEDSNDAEGRLITKPVKKTSIVSFNKLILKIDEKSKKTEDNTKYYKKKIEKGIKNLEKILQEIYDEM